MLTELAKYPVMPSKKTPTPRGSSATTKPTVEKERKSVEGNAVMCDLSEQDHNIFMAISLGKLHRVPSLLEEIGDINVRNYEQQTLLIHAIYNTTGTDCNHLSRLLISAGCNVNAQDVYGRTALMYACADDTGDDAVRQLIRNLGCDPNLTDCEGCTALMFAVAGDSVTAVELLLKHRKIRDKVNVNIKNVAGLTALDMAVCLKSVDCCRIIVECAGHKLASLGDKDALSELIGPLNEPAETTVRPKSSKPNSVKSNSVQPNGHILTTESNV